ncbi:MFS transporter [Streptomyces sp. NPDC046862]|uniref:MFS transporter n=1 Tax=Streptomyces sp. NPDC046862 TaxID=3154603 RepID=UPI003454B2EA
MSSTATHPSREASRLTPRQWAILAVILAAAALDLMDSTITNIAAPTIVRELGGGESLVKWLGASYALALGVLLVVGGRLGDRFGKRRVFLIGMAGFGITSLLCAISFDPAMLIGARFLQGAFGALLIPQGIGILIATFSRAQFPTAASMFGPVLGGAAIVGPIFAGFLIGADLWGLTWRPMFLINILLCAAGLIAGWLILPKDTSLQPVAIDGLGSGLLAVTMVGFIYGLIEGSTAGWGPTPLLAVFVGLVFLGLFVWRQRRASNPLILPSLLGNRGFTSGLLVGLAYFAAVNGFAYVVSLYFQLGLGFAPAGAALAMSPMMLGIIVSSFAARPLIPKLGRRLVIAGLVITIAAVAGMLITGVALGTTVSAWALAPSVFVLGLGMGACLASIYDVTIGDVRKEEAGSASGSLSAVQQLANAMGAAIVTTVYFDAASTGGQPHGFLTALGAIGGVLVLCFPFVWLLPREAPANGRP